MARKMPGLKRHIKPLSALITDYPGPVLLKKLNGVQMQRGLEGMPSGNGVSWDVDTMYGSRLLIVLNFNFLAVGFLSHHFFFF